jgi:hypothetical protein
VNFGTAVAANMTLTAKIFLDNFTSSSLGSSRTINSANYANEELFVEWKDVDITGNNNFVLELRWSGTALLPVLMPIVIDVDPILD